MNADCFENTVWIRPFKPVSEPVIQSRLMPVAPNEKESQAMDEKKVEQLKREIDRLENQLTKRRKELSLLMPTSPKKKPVSIEQEIKQICEIARCPERAAEFIKGGWTAKQVLQCLLFERGLCNNGDLSFDAIYSRRNRFTKRR